MRAKRSLLLGLHYRLCLCESHGPSVYDRSALELEIRGPERSVVSQLQRGVVMEFGTGGYKT